MILAGRNGRRVPFLTSAGGYGGPACQYEATLREDDADATVLPNLTAEDLKERTLEISMARVMPSQVVQTIDELFPHAAKNEPASQLSGNSAKLLGVLNLLKDVPDELIALSSADYAELVLAQSTIEDALAYWRAGSGAGNVPHVNGFDVITVIRRALAKCPDEYPPSTTSDLLFIKDAALRESIRQDVGAANRALNNAEWKAATVLAGAAIEALLHWRLKEPSPGGATIDSAVTSLTGTRKMPFGEIDRWDLDQFIEIATHFDLLTPDTRSAAKLAQNFRNLIHPGRAARLAQTCDRGTAYSAIGALEHVIRDLS